MNSDIYEAKYQKYKTKYILLKDVYNKIYGGKNPIRPDSNNVRTMIEELEAKNKPIIEDVKAKKNYEETGEKRPLVRSDARRNLSIPNLPSISDFSSNITPSITPSIPNLQKPSVAPESEEKPSKISFIMEELHKAIDTYYFSIECCLADMQEAIKSKKINRHQKRYLEIAIKYHEMLVSTVREVMKKNYPRNTDFIKGMNKDNADEIIKEKYYIIIMKIIRANRKEFTGLLEELTSLKNQDLPYYYLTYNSNNKIANRDNMSCKVTGVPLDCILLNAGQKLTRIQMLLEQIDKETNPNNKHINIINTKLKKLIFAINEYKRSIDETKIKIQFEINSTPGGREIYNQTIGEKLFIKNSIKDKLEPLSDQVSKIDKDSAKEIKEKNEELAEIINNLKM